MTIPSEKAMAHSKYSFRSGGPPARDSNVLITHTVKRRPTQTSDIRGFESGHGQMYMSDLCNKVLTDISEAGRHLRLHQGEEKPRDLQALSEKVMKDIFPYFPRRTIVVSWSVQQKGLLSNREILKISSPTTPRFMIQTNLQTDC